MADNNGRYPAQVVFTTTAEQREETEAVARRFHDALGTSRAEVIRRCIEAGMPAVLRKLEREAKRA